ncbi:hypothetical protein ACHAWC_001466 [Mediolabrus comicus]
MNMMAEKLELLDSPNAAGKGELTAEEEHGDGDIEEEEGNSDDEESVESLSAEQLEERGRALVAYQDMMSKNRYEWEYTAEDLCLEDIGDDEFEADEMLTLSESLKACTIKMRRGEYHYQLNEDLDENYDVDLDFHGVLLEPHENVRNFEERIHFHGALKPHWEEFADALETFDLTLDILDMM